MTVHYEDTDGAMPADCPRTSPFPETVPIGAAESDELFSVLDKVARAAGHHERLAATGVRVARAGAAFRSRLVDREPVAIEAVLDLAAELLEASVDLRGAALDLEVLALEGLAGRLTEHLVGAGPFEGTPLGGGR